MLVIAEHRPSLQTELKWKQVEVHFESELIHDLSEYNHILYSSNIYIDIHMLYAIYRCTNAFTPNQAQFIL